MAGVFASHGRRLDADLPGNEANHDKTDDCFIYCGPVDLQRPILYAAGTEMESKLLLTALYTSIRSTQYVPISIRREEL